MTWNCLHLQIQSSSKPFSQYLTAVYPNGSPQIVCGYLEQVVTQFLNSSPQYRTSLAKSPPEHRSIPYSLWHRDKRLPTWDRPGIDTSSKMKLQRSDTSRREMSYHFLKGSSYEVAKISRFLQSRGWGNSTVPGCSTVKLQSQRQSKISRVYQAQKKWS